MLFVLSACTPPPSSESPPPDIPPQNDDNGSNQQLTCPETSLPWNTEYLSNDSNSMIDHTNTILENTGLAGQGETIINLSKQYGVNPAFTLAMFRKEASFADPRYRAYRNNNPGNINATGNCRDVSPNEPCSGVYGEISTDGRFGIYQTMADGIEAYYLLLSSEYKPGTKRDCDDITCIISAYAPSTENDTAAYINQVTNWTQGYQCQILGLTESVVVASTPISLPTPTEPPPIVPTPKPPIIEGRWEGPVYQPNAPFYTTVLTLMNCNQLNTKCGFVDYPELSCSGDITFLYERNGVYRLLENITNDPNSHCAPEVNLYLRQVSGNSWIISYEEDFEASVTKTE